MNINPYIKPGFSGVNAVMLDVIIALLPLVAAAWFAFGNLALSLIGTAVAFALLTDFISSVVFLKKYDTAFDGSAIVTGLLLSFTLSPLTPWYVVAFGAVTAILFGKILWGGLGKNKFNPALLGREFMAVFFASAMTSPHIWDTKSLVNIPAQNLFPGIESGYLSGYLNGLVYKTTGALGEYSVLLIIAGGLYLLIRKRISWHIPFALLSVFTLMMWLIEDGDDLKFSLAGMLLGTLFMATDMPSSPVTAQGKLYYGAMIGLVTIMLIAANVRYEYLSYSILILNGFSQVISKVFRPRAWGEQPDRKKKAEQLFLLSMSVIGVTLAVISLYYYNMLHYLIYVYIVYIIIKFNFSFNKTINNAI